MSMPADMPAVTPSHYPPRPASGRLPKPRPESAYARTARRLGIAERTVELGVPRAIRLLTEHIRSLREIRDEEAVVLLLAPLDEATQDIGDTELALALAEEKADSSEGQEQLGYRLEECTATARPYIAALMRQGHRSFRLAAVIRRRFGL